MTPSDLDAAAEAYCHELELQEVGNEYAAFKAGVAWITDQIPTHHLDMIQTLKNSQQQLLTECNQLRAECINLTVERDIYKRHADEMADVLLCWSTSGYAEKLTYSESKKVFNRYRTFKEETQS